MVYQFKRENKQTNKSQLLITSVTNYRTEEHGQRISRLTCPFISLLWNDLVQNPLHPGHSGLVGMYMVRLPSLTSQVVGNGWEGLDSIRMM